jgi:cysteine-rich secretory family protein
VRLSCFAPLVAAAVLPMPAGAASFSTAFAARFPARILAAHNAERARAGRPPLVWDNALGAAAAAYAQQLAFTGRFQHSNRRARPGTGENLWMGPHGYYPVEAMVGSWASEKRWFRRGVFPNVSRTGDWSDVGHYTQIVWPTTTRVGCAVASTGRVDYLVCRYANAGNIDGRWLS